MSHISTKIKQAARSMKKSFLKTAEKQNWTWICTCASTTGLLQFIKAFYQSWLATCHLLLNSFLLAGQAVSTQHDKLLQLQWNKRLFCHPIYNFRKSYVSVHICLCGTKYTLTCQRWPLPRGRWGGSWNRRPGQWVYVQLHPSRPTCSHCSGAECTSLHAKSAPAHVQQLQSVICCWITNIV